MIDIIKGDSSFIELKHTPSKEGNQVMISGKFKVNYETNGLVVKGAEVLKHIALAVTRSGSYQSVTPFQDVIVFSDDVTETPKGCSGSFNFNVFDKIAFDGDGDYYIICSIGTVLSNIVHVRYD